MRAIASTAVLAREYGRTMRPGQVVDFEERLPCGGTLGDQVRRDCFVPVEPAGDAAPPPVRAHKRGPSAAPDSAKE